MLTPEDFDFVLPHDRIAQRPAPQRRDARLLDGSTWPPADRRFADFADLLRTGDLLVFNDTRVVKARLLGRKASGGAVELLVERLQPDERELWAHLRASRAPRAGSRLLLGEAPGFEAEVLGRAGPDGSLFHLRFPAAVLPLLEAHGHVPLPPYIEHDDDADDASRYQTVFARHAGAVAAPTAALHFDEAMLAELRARGHTLASVTLHVGAGTFQPVRAATLAQHRMHREWFDVPAETVSAVADCRARGGRVVAIGTTSLRALEAAAEDGELRASRGDTALFITPGYRFRVVDALLTNFHLPRSTLLMLVAAFAGLDHVRALYAHAVATHYRFFSYGDASWLLRAQDCVGGA